MSHRGNAMLNLLFGEGDVGFGPAKWGNDGIPQTRKAQFCDVCNTHFSVDALTCPNCRAVVAAARERRLLLRVRGDISDKRTMAGHCQTCGERVPTGRRLRVSGRPKRHCSDECMRFGGNSRARTKQEGAL